MRRALLAASLLATATLHDRAHASEPPLAAPPGKVVWQAQWPKFSAFEGAATLGFTALGIVLDRRIKEPKEARVDLEVPLLDPTARWMLRGRTKQVQDVFGRYSDWGFRMMAFYPYVDALVALGVHHSPEVAAQIALIDAEALTLSGITQYVVSHVVARNRPYVQDCNENGETITRRCGGPSDLKSFYSGHSAAAFTSAGLVCVHHQHLPLYGGGPVEAWACTWALGVATATGLFRIVSDSHYASDVLFGAGIGWFYGYVMPRLLHYRHGGLARARRGAFAWSPSFVPTDGGAAVGLSGALPF